MDILRHQKLCFKDMKGSQVKKKGYPHEFLNVFMPLKQEINKANSYSYCFFLTLTSRRRIFAHLIILYTFITCYADIVVIDPFGKIDHFLFSLWRTNKSLGDQFR